jgi:hypothetical protein
MKNDERIAFAGVFAIILCLIIFLINTLTLAGSSSQQETAWQTVVENQCGYATFSVRENDRVVYHLNLQLAEKEVTVTEKQLADISNGGTSKTLGHQFEIVDDHLFQNDMIQNAQAVTEKVKVDSVTLQGMDVTNFKVTATYEVIYEIEGVAYTAILEPYYFIVMKK